MRTPGPGGPPSPGGFEGQARGGGADPARPGDTGTWRTLSTADPARAGAGRSAASERVHRFADNLSLRARLTLIYGMLFFAAGSVLVLVNYLIVAVLLNALLSEDSAAELAAHGYLIEEVLTHVTRFSLLALFLVGLLAVALGYAVAGRALSPLQKITRIARRLSERDLHERIALSGPDDEIRELADTFDGMLERLDRAFDGQRRFVANASHELRTPLAINRTLLEVALTAPDVSSDLKSVGRTLLETNARHERLIDGLLFLAKSDRELEVRARVDLGEVAGTVLSQLAAEVAESGLALRKDLRPAAVVGDPVLLERLVANLVENALKYNVPDGEITVRSGLYEGRPAVQVENSGKMIPAYEIEGLFEPFRRGSGDRVGSGRSAGLGLSIVRSVVRAHEGVVTAWPRAGGGLVITVCLPVPSGESPERR
ncbi:Signal transduction histidine kinase [Nocardiopsis flavescens]|uniref:histidine kinase n=1 Tax=Nocardiopsis flavescens TaxID=758803 RepID=A0A1M6PEW5_9ACTN|nr:Signal transduction histidine kinase [Nocardiopsis flavescens]